MSENIIIVTKVIGSSTIVRAAASISGWYVAALACFTAMGRCAKRAGISEIEDKTAQSKALAIRVGYRAKVRTEYVATYKKRILPREKYCDVSSLKKTEPLIRAV
jgi:hypothetical protein